MNALFAGSLPKGLQQPGLSHTDANLVASTQLTEPPPAASQGMQQLEAGNREWSQNLNPDAPPFSVHCSCPTVA